MALVDFREQLEAADSVLDLARQLGERCLAGSADLKEMRQDEQTSKDLELIESLAGQRTLAAWEGAVQDPANFERRLGIHLAAAVKRARARQPLDFLGVLRGLCRRPLGELYRTIGQVELARGLPVPFAVRPLPEAIDGEPTTSVETLHDVELLFPHSFDLYDHVAGGELPVVLDFSHAERLDALTWDEEGRLPRIATLHPEGGGEYDIERQGAGLFFGVRPARWDVEAVKGLLKRAKAAGARLALLPELSLPTPGELEKELRDDPSAYPPLIVAGSAHCEIEAMDGTAAIRTNESRVYLDGKCVAVARKHHPFQTKKIGSETFEKPLWEDLTAERKTVTVLSGRRTRLGVAICADVLEKDMPKLLIDAGVNLLLVPAMTPKTGSFNSPLTGIAGFCQGVAAVANTRWSDDGKPFLCMFAVPRADPQEQSAVFRGDSRSPVPQLAILDPNEPLPDAVSWP